MNEETYRARFEGMQLTELKAFSKTLGLKGVSTLKKKELIEVLIKESLEKDQSAPVAASKEDKPSRRPGRPRKVVKKETSEAESVKEQEPAEDEKPKERKPYVFTKPHPAERRDVSEMTSSAREGARDTSERRPTLRGTSDRKSVSRDGSERRQFTERRPAINRDRIGGRNYEPRQTENRYDNRSEENRYDARPVENKNYDARPIENRSADVRETEADSAPNFDNLPKASGILEVLPEGYGFIRSENFLSGDQDVYVSPMQIRKFNLKTGDIITGPTKKNKPEDKFQALVFLESVNNADPFVAQRRPAFEKLTPIFPNQRIHLESPGCKTAMRVVDLLSPIGKGQRGMIVAQPKAGKTTLLKQIAKAVIKSNPEMHVIILLIDERPEEVTDMKETVTGDNVEIIYSTFDEKPEHHRKVSEMVIERAKRLVEQNQDVIILLDSITRLTRAYNMTIPTSGRTLSGGLDPAALYMPKRFFGAARNMKEGGSLTILATALVETGSKMDDVVFEEFKGTGNMELVLDRKLSERRIFPAIDLARSSTRREDLLLTDKELAACDIIRKALSGLKNEEAAERILDLFVKTKNNREFVDLVIKRNYI